MINACSLFKYISQLVWADLSDRHNYFLNMDERGITDTIIYCIVKYHSNFAGSNLVVRKAKNEPVEGNDLDLYILNSQNTYNRYALQAKVLSAPEYSKDKNNNSIKIKCKKYADTHTKKGKPKSYQWSKLIKWEKVNKGAPSLFKSYYLFYNGFSSRQLHLLSLMNKVHASSLFGCSLVRPHHVEQKTRGILNKKGTRYKRKAACYDDFHSLNKCFAIPWHDLVCNPKLLSQYKAKTYTSRELASDPNFTLVQQLFVDTPINRDNALFLQGDQTSPQSLAFMPRYQIIIGVEPGEIR